MPEAPRFPRIVAHLLDLILFILVGLGLAGGIEWNGHRILTHGADLRRAAILIALLVAWALPKSRTQSIGLRLAAGIWRALHVTRARWVAWGSCLVLMAAISVLQCLALRVPLYDVGIFHQIIWAVANGHGFVSTISGAGNFLLDHFSPTLALLAPLFAITGSSPLILPVMQPVLLMTGVAAWIWLAERLDGKAKMGGTLAASATLFGLTFDSLWGNRHWGFHENAIAFAALSWAFAGLVSRADSGLLNRRTRFGILALFLVGALSKEILLLDVAFALGVWAFQIGSIARHESPSDSTDRSGLKLEAAVCVLVAILLIAGFVVFERMHHPADKNYFARYYSYLGNDLRTFASTLLTSPWVVVQAIGAGELLRYAVRVLLPWLGLPIYALLRDRARGVWLLALLPSLASAALSTDVSLRRASFHYVLELWPVLAAITLVQLARIRSHRLATAWALLALLACDHDPLGLMREYARGAIDQTQARELMAAIPADVGVSADELAGTWVASRLKVTRWPALEILGGKCPERLVLRGEKALSEVARICEARFEKIQGEGGWSFLTR